MLDRLRRTLKRRERLLHVRKIQQDRAEQALAVLLKQERELIDERVSYEHAHESTHSALLSKFDDPTERVMSDDLALCARRMNALTGQIRETEKEIEALQPPITAGREEVLARYKARRAMEILRDTTRGNVAHEELRQEQVQIDDITVQRFRRNNGSNGYHS
ncbi:hypothetical protein FJZ36_09285 [Candidatus Poribacteria bacterium]|nr:hypothetical protein [Candidatus Poribacteria bacterium]